MSCASSMSTSSTSRGPLALDLDGTLVDPKPRQVAVIGSLLVGEPGAESVDVEELWSLKRDGLTTREALVRLGVDAALGAELADRWAHSVEEPRWLRLDRLLPGVADALSRLAATGTRPVVLTARRHEDRVRGQAASLGLLRWCSELMVVSPDFAAEEKAAKLASLRCRAFIGDTESDAKAAELVRVPYAAVTTGQRSGAFLRSRKLPVFDSLDQALRDLGEG